jgi:hypothetical protein
MSLAPGEQRALTRIEEDLRRSDPRLAAMLATFTLPLHCRAAARWEQLARWRPGRRFITAMVTLATLCGIVLACVLTRQPSQPPCPPDRPASVAGPVSGCPPAGNAGPSAPARPGARMAPAAPPPAAPAATGHRPPVGG